MSTRLNLAPDGLWPLAHDQMDGEQLPWQRPTTPLPFSPARICDHLDSVLYALKHPLFAGGQEWADGAVECATDGLAAPLNALSKAIPPSEVAATWTEGCNRQILQVAEHLSLLRNVSTTNLRGKDAICVKPAVIVALRRALASLHDEVSGHPRPPCGQAELQSFLRSARQFALALESHSEDIAVMHSAAACLPSLMHAAWQLHMLLPVRIDAIWEDWGRVQVRYPSGYAFANEDHVGCSHEELLLPIRVETAVALRQWCDELESDRLMCNSATGMAGSAFDQKQSITVVADPTAFVSATELIREYTPASMALSYKELTTILKNNPCIKSYAPRPQRLQIHLADWMKYISQQRRKGLLDEEDAAEVAERTAALRRGKTR